MTRTASAYRDPEAEVAMRLLDERRKMVAAIGEKLYRQRVDELRELIVKKASRDGIHHLEAALALVALADKKLSPTEAKVYGMLFMIVAHLEMPENARARRGASDG